MRQKPNVLLLFADQFRWDCIGALGEKPIVTPHLDALCREGAVFTRAYSPSPVCVPARMSMFYGQYPFNTGVTNNSSSFTPHQKNFMQALGDNGYYCHGIGKMHFTHDRDGLNGFHSRERQEELSASADQDEYLKYIQSKGYRKVFDMNGQRSEMYYIPQVSQLPAEDHPTQWIGDRSVEFIRNYRRQKPFFLMSSFIHPHPPFSPPTPWNKMYRVPFVDDPIIPDDYEKLLVYINHYQNRYKYRDNGIDKNLVKTMRAFYYACISFIDYQIGRIREALERKGILDETLILFTSDHGELLGDYNSFGKRCMLDSSAKIPFLMRYPAGIKPQSRYDMPVNLVDIYPTLLDAATASVPGLKLDGVSLFDLICGKTGREYVYSQFSEGAKGLYMLAGKHEKLVYSAADNKTLYFDARTSPREEKAHVNSRKPSPRSRIMKEALISLLKAHVPAAVSGNTFKKHPPIKVPSEKTKCLIYQDQPWCRKEESLLPPPYTVKFPKNS